MGARIGPTYRLGWNADIAGMLKHGTKVALACQDRDCLLWVKDVDVEELAMGYGHDATLWGLEVSCPRCAKVAKFHASPGPSTPFIPLHDARSI